MTKRNSLGSVTLAGARITFLGQAGRLTFQLLGIFVLARLLSPSDFGIFGMVAAVTAFAAVIGDFGLSSAAIQSKFLSSKQKSNLFWINLSVGLTGAGVLAAASNLIGNFYARPEIVPIVLALAVNFLLTSSATQFLAEATRQLKFSLLACTDVIAQAVALVIAVWFANLGAGPWALVFQQLTVSMVTLIILVTMTGWLPGLPGKAPMRALMSFGINTFAVQVLNYLTSSLDSVLTGRYLGAYTLGLYDRAFQLFRLPTQQIATPLSRVVLPIVSRLQDNLERLQSYLEKALIALAYTIGGLMVFLAVLSEPIVELALGSQWHESAPILAILAIGGFFQGLGYIFQWAFMATGKVAVQLRYAIFTRILMVALICAGVPFGVHGIALAVSLGLMINWIILLIFAIPKTGLNPRGFMHAIRRPLFLHACAGVSATLVSSVIFYGVENQWVYGLISMIIVYTLIISLTPQIRHECFLVLKYTKMFRK